MTDDWLMTVIDEYHTSTAWYIFLQEICSRGGTWAIVETALSMESSWFRYVGRGRSTFHLSHTHSGSLGLEKEIDGFCFSTMPCDPMLKTNSETTTWFFVLSLRTTHRCFYTENPLHTDAFTHRSFYRQKFLHTYASTQSSFYKLTPLNFTQKLLHTS